MGQFIEVTHYVSGKGYKVLLNLDMVSYLCLEPNETPSFAGKYAVAMGGHYVLYVTGQDLKRILNALKQ